MSFPTWVGAVCTSGSGSPTYFDTSPTCKWSVDKAVTGKNAYGVKKFLPGVRVLPGG